MGQAMLPLMIIGTAAQAGSTLMAAKEKSNAAKFESQQYQMREQQLYAQKQQFLTAGARDEATRRGELNSQIGTIMAMRAGRGVGQNSPTGTVILDDLTRRAESDIGTNQANYRTSADRSRMDAEQAGLSSAFAQRRARSAMTQGYVQAIGQIANAGMKASSGGYFG
jgi:hypothetical protein